MDPNPPGLSLSHFPAVLQIICQDTLFPDFLREKEERLPRFLRHLHSLLATTSLVPELKKLLDSYRLLIALAGDEVTRLYPFRTVLHTLTTFAADIKLARECFAILEFICAEFGPRLTPHFQLFIPRLVRLTEARTEDDIQAQCLRILKKLVITEDRHAKEALKDLRPFPNTPLFVEVRESHSKLLDTRSPLAELEILLDVSPESLRVDDIRHLRYRFSPQTNFDLHQHLLKDRHLTTMVRKHLLKCCHAAQPNDPVIPEIARFLGEFGAFDRNLYFFSETPADGPYSLPFPSIHKLISFSCHSQSWIHQLFPNSLTRKLRCWNSLLNTSLIPITRSCKTQSPPCRC